MSPISNRGVPRRDLLKLAGGVATASALMGASGCGLLGGSQSSGQGNGQVEKSKIRVGALPITDHAPLYLARENGSFQEQGLEVEIVNAANGTAALNSMIGGDYDITYSSYVPFFQAQAKGVADLKIVADCASASRETSMIMTYPGSSVKEPADLEDATIAISAAGTISELLTKVAMRAHGVSFEEAEFTPISFPNMPAALQQQRVDAAMLTEPFVTLAARGSGAVPILDVSTGPAEDLPLSGYGSTAEFVEENPKTVDAFQRAMAKATKEAQDRSKIEPLLPKFAKIDPKTASIVGLLNMHSRADATRLERVPRLMREFGFLDKEVQVANMIVDQPKN
ncbi:ABC transporter substrate-binding protein [Parasphingorhabdus pacifica]